VRVALIGPVPPQLGGATPGGVATHQLHLAVGLAAAGIDAPLLATNASAGPGEWPPASPGAWPPASPGAWPTGSPGAWPTGSPGAWPTGSPGAWPPAGGVGQASGTQAPVRLYRMARPAWSSHRYRSAVGYGRAARYALRLSLSKPQGSRRIMLEQLLWYRRFLAGVRPELVHVQHPLERCLYARMVRCYEHWRMPLVVTAHSLSGEHQPDVIERLMAPNLRAADWVVAVSPHIAREAIQLGVRPNRVRVIRSGVDVEQFRPRDRSAARVALGVAVDTPVILFVGNLEPRKQVDVLLRALARVCQELPSARLIVIGSGESAGVEDQTARLARLTGELELGDVVRFTGRIDDRQLQDWYAAADVFALPSSSEAQGIVALEAMACGLPVVATAVGGLVGTIEDGQTGCLVPSGDAAALASALLMLLQDPLRRQTIGAAARQTVEREFSWKQAIEATLAVYGEVLERT
jgi:glycosyltransferase involved in cell wall biosynthesis